MTSPATPKIFSMGAFINSFWNKIPSFTEDRSPSWDDKIREAMAKYNDFIIGLRIFAQYGVFTDIYTAKNIFLRELQIRYKKGTTSCEINNR